jgi:hypothetical protein
MFRHNGQWIGRAWPATTDPGVYHREHPMNVHGVAILKPGQYRNAFRLGQHSGYPALQQNAPLDVWRDNDHNAALAPGHAHESGMFGINVHHASAEHTSTRVDKWSAGCQVLASPDDFAELMALASQNGGPFTYTLLEQGDFAT